MAFVQNFPFLSILLSLFSGPLCSILSGKWAKRVNTGVIVTTGVMSAFVLQHVISTGQSYVYQMGHFPAPWGNEIRVGILEAFMACFFCAVMLLCMLGGIREREEQIQESKQNLYYVMVNLLLCSLLALIYTNDLFTAYVFVEINTISACGLIMIRQTGRTYEAAARYMIMSLSGSGLLLLGICYLYAVTGHLLMSNIREQVQFLAQTGQHHLSLMVALGLMSVGLAMKSALYPFHTWLPDAYGYSTLSSSAILSSLVSCGTQGIYFPADQDLLPGGGIQCGKREQSGQCAVCVRYHRDDHGFFERYQGKQSHTDDSLLFGSTDRIHLYGTGACHGGGNCGGPLPCAVPRSHVAHTEPPKRCCLWRRRDWGMPPETVTDLRISQGRGCGTNWRERRFWRVPCPWWVCPCFRGLSQNFSLPRRRWDMPIRCFPRLSLLLSAPY